MTPLIKWYINHGLQISNITKIIRAEKGKPFKNFVNLVTEARKKEILTNHLDGMLIV